MSSTRTSGTGPWYVDLSTARPRRDDAPQVGIITTEDIIEELIQDEIVGDDDEYVDDAKASTRRPGVVETNSKRYDPLALLRQLSREDPSERFDAPPSATLAPRPSLESRMSSI